LPTREVVKFITCRCGMTIESSPAGIGSHRRSVFHLESQRLRALLRKPCLSFAEIGRRVGLSTERVRQVGQQLGQTGQQRLALCRTEKRQLRLYAAPLVKKTAKRCRVLGFAFEPLDRRTALINGHRCFIRTCWEAVKNDRKYIRIHRTREMNGDYIIFWLRDLAFIFPKHKMPDETFFALTPLSSGPKANRHDYSNYANAWPSLSRAKSAPDLES
jgi:hypothetical protein